MENQIYNATLLDQMFGSVNLNQSNVRRKENMYKRQNAIICNISGSNITNYQSLLKRRKNDITC